MSEAAWIVVETEWGDWHIMPVSDVMPHVATAGCWCGPCRDSDDDYVVIHNAIDEVDE